MGAAQKGLRSSLPQVCASRGWGYVSAQTDLHPAFLGDASLLGTTFPADGDAVTALLSRTEELAVC